MAQEALMAVEELWQQETKKLGGESLVQVIEEIRDNQRVMLDRLDLMERRHSASEASISLLNRAFAGGDIEGHRRYHELIIENTAEKRRLRIAIQEKTISGLIWAAIVGCGAAVWHELVHLIAGAHPL
jgi:hypothetical protein